MPGNVLSPLNACFIPQEAFEEGTINTTPILWYMKGDLGT